MYKNKFYNKKIQKYENKKKKYYNFLMPYIIL